MHEEALTLETQELLNKIQDTTGVLKDFYLAGGTALALQLGHRKSVDLDFFSANFPGQNRLLQKLAHLNPTITLQEDGTLIALINNIKVSFLRYPYPLLEKTRQFQKIQLADVLDITCMKLVAISQRGTKKDFVDLYVILQNYSLDDLFKAFDKKYQGVNYQHLHILKSLVYFDDAEKNPDPDYLIPINWEAVKAYFRTTL